MKRIKKIRLIVIIAVVVIGIGTWITIAKVKAAKAAAPTIETAKVEKGTVVRSVSATGVLQPLAVVDVKSNAGGQVDVLAVDVGTEVKAGQLIAKIDPTTTRTAYQQARADLSAANAKLSQSKESLTLQDEQTVSSITEAQESYKSAQARLAQAEAQAKIQPQLTKTSIDQAQANLDSANETLRELKEAGAPQGKAQAKATFDRATAQLEQATRDLARQQSLFDKGFIAGSQVDTAKLARDNAQADLNSAKERMDTLTQEYDSQLRGADARVKQSQAALDSAKANAIADKVKEQDVLAARASVRQAKASLDAATSNKRQSTIKAADILSSEATVVRNQAQMDNAQTQLNYTTVTAPRDGIILKKYVEPGTIITSGQSSFAGTGAGTSIVQLGDTTRMFVYASVDETDVANVEEGQTVDITLDAYPDEIFEGKVTRIDPETTVTQNVTTIPVTVEIDSPDARLKPGMNATCDFIIERAENALLVPTTAVSDDNGKYYVTVMKNGQQSQRQIEIGIAGDDNTQVVKGLKQGEEVVTAVIESQSSTQRTGGGAPGGPGMMRGMGGGGGRR